MHLKITEELAARLAAIFGVYKRNHMNKNDPSPAQGTCAECQGSLGDTGMIENGRKVLACDKGHPAIGESADPVCACRYRLSAHLGQELDCPAVGDNTKFHAPAAPIAAPIAEMPEGAVERNFSTYLPQGFENWSDEQKEKYQQKRAVSLQSFTVPDTRTEVQIENDAIVAMNRAWEQSPAYDPDNISGLKETFFEGYMAAHPPEDAAQVTVEGELSVLLQMSIADLGNVNVSQQNLTTRALMLAYAKHNLGSDEIGWNELGHTLLDALCEAVGDENYQNWVQRLKGISI